MQLRVKLLNENAKLPTLGHEGDLGYDIYASEDVKLIPGRVFKVATGIAVDANNPGLVTVYNGDNIIRAQYVDEARRKPYGLIIKDRSSMAAKGVFTHGGVIDSGYRGEVVVLMSLLGSRFDSYSIREGDKIAQLVPVPVLTGKVLKTEDFEEPTTRGAAGFGSTGK